MNTVIKQQNTSQPQFLVCFFIGLILVFIAAWVGIFTRPLSHLAFFWPANALLLGLILRFPTLRHPLTLAGGGVGFIIADLMTGNTVYLTIVLTLINLMSVVLAFFFYLALQRTDQQSTNPFDIRLAYPYLIATLLASYVAALIAIMILPLVPDTFFNTQPTFIDFMSWWSGEMFNYVLVLPIMMSFPTWKKIKNQLLDRRKLFEKITHVQEISPLIAVLISCFITHQFFAPGAMLYPLATLMWAAVVYSMFKIALITTLVCLTLYHSLSYLYLDNIQNDFLYPMISIRIGLIILAITTLFMGVMSLNRRRLFMEMRYLADHDGLTGALNRRSFLDQAERLLHRPQNYPLSLMMLDLDHFKHLNDRYGHHVGDLALKHFSHVVRHHLRENDIFCRIGGEEFIILLKNTELDHVLQIAERIRITIAETSFYSDHDTEVSMTVSIGVAHQAKIMKISLQIFMQQADEALYQAKHLGRNQVQWEKIPMQSSTF